MNTACRTALAICVFTLSVSAGQRPRSSYDPAQQHPPKQHDGLIEFVLKQVNPGDKDYGQEVEQLRKRITEAGLHNVPAGVSLVLLTLSFLIILHQNKERKHREIIAARFLAWYHNELVRARETAKETIRRNQQLKILIDDQVEPGLPPKTVWPPADVLARGTATVEPGLNPAVQKKAPSSDGDLVTEISRLRQKVASQEETEKVLRQQASQLNRRLQEEKQRNRALKGE